MNTRQEVTGRKPSSTSDAGQPQDQQHSRAPPGSGEPKAGPGKVCQPKHRSAGPVGAPRGPPIAIGIIEPDAYSISEFCDRHRISVQLFYKLDQQGKAPATFYAGVRRLVSKEAAAAWRREREAENA